MTDALGQLLASGIGVALSPIPIIAVILMLTTAPGPRGDRGEHRASVLGAAIFIIIIGSVTVAGPVIGSLIAPARMGPPLAEAKLWMQHNNSTIMIVLLAVLGVSRTGEGLAGLLH